MVSQDYLTKHNPPPGTLKRVFDQEVIPIAINLSGDAEVLLTRLAERTRRSPVTALLAAVAVGYLARTALSALSPARPG